VPGRIFLSLADEEAKQDRRARRRAFGRRSAHAHFCRSQRLCADPSTAAPEHRRLAQASHVQRRHADHLVATVAGELVGNLGLTRFTRPRRAHVGEIGMGVRDDWQGKGVGSALLEAALDLADNWLGLRRIELHVHADNERAIALYRRFGFEPEGTHRAYAIRNGVYVDSLSMARLIEGPRIPTAAKKPKSRGV
jgi:L-phenylalanine/L-methionine N-acetyltransferase